MIDEKNSCNRWWREWKIIRRWYIFFIQYKKIDEEIVKLSNKEKPHFLFINHAMISLEIQESYFQAMKKIYGDKFNCICEDLKTTDLEDKKKVKQKLDCAALEIINNQYRLVLCDEKVYGIKAYWDNNKFFEEKILDLNEFKNINELLNKK